MQRPHGVMFHHFRDRVHPAGQGAISAEELDQMIRFLGRDRILSAPDWLERAARGTLAAGDICLTFDDNLRCQFDVAAPVLERWGIKAFFFVYSSVLEGKIEKLEVYRYFRTTCFHSVDEFYRVFWKTTQTMEMPDVNLRLREFNPAEYLQGFPFYSDEDRRFRFVRDEVLGPDRYGAVMDAMLLQAGIDERTWAPRLWMDDQCLRTLRAQGHVIGLHSHGHPTRLERLGPIGQRREYHANFDYLTRLLGEEPVAMSHPCNSYNTETLAILRELGIRLGFRANMAQEAASELEYPREDHANVLRMMQK